MLFRFTLCAYVIILFFSLLAILLKQTQLLHPLLLQVLENVLHVVNNPA